MASVQEVLGILRRFLSLPILWGRLPACRRQWQAGSFPTRLDTTGIALGQARRAQRNFAERALGLAVRSANVARIGSVATSV